LFLCHYSYFKIVQIIYSNTHKGVEMTFLDETLADLPAMNRSIRCHYKWYCHATPASNAASIRVNGLIPKNPGCAAPLAVTKALGANPDKIICLNPLGTNLAPGFSQSETYICLAVDNESMPSQIGLDWSYPYAQNIGEDLRKQNQSIPAYDIFYWTIKRSGSLVIYNPIPASILRVCCKNSPPHNPLGWPSIQDTQDSDLLEFT